MISELLDLADRLEVQTPRPFEPMPVHYFIDLTGDGEILAITPVYGHTKEKTCEPELGKVMDCPAFFSLKIKSGTEDEIQAAAGGGVSVAEAGHGDVREIFCTEIKTQQGKPPKIAIISPPVAGKVDLPEAGEELEDDDDETDSYDQDGDSLSGVGRKNQYYRHDGWLRRIKGFTDSQPDLGISKALKGFIDTKHRLSSPAILGHFSLSDPAKAEANAYTPDEKHKGKGQFCRKPDQYAGQKGYTNSKLSKGK